MPPIIPGRRLTLYDGLEVQAVTADKLTWRFWLERAKYNGEGVCAVSIYEDKWKYYDDIPDNPWRNGVVTKEMDVEEAAKYVVLVPLEILSPEHNLFGEVCP